MANDAEGVGVLQDYVPRIHPAGRGLGSLLVTAAQWVFGRPTLYGVIAGGDAGAAKAVGILNGEMDKVMAQIGCPALSQLGPDFLYAEADGMGRNLPG